MCQSCPGPRDEGRLAPSIQLAQPVGEVAHAPELLVRDLDLDLLAEVRDRWAFYRDRRPDQYETLVKP